MRENTVMNKMQTGAPSCGLWLRVPFPISVEIIARMGYEWVLIDAQHGYWSYPAILNALQVITPTPTMPFVRVPGNEFSTIGRVLDAGAMGILVPLVNSAADAQQAVSAARYAPLGSRSLDGLRLYGLPEYDNFIAESNSKIFLAVQIESAQAVERADEIAAVEGIDCLYVGPGDLALSLGCPAGSEEHEAAAQHVLQVCKQQGLVAGYAAKIDEVHQRAEQGFQFLSCGVDANLFFDAARQHLKALPK